MPLIYRGTLVEDEREQKGRNYCKSKGVTHALEELVVDGLVMAPRPRGVISWLARIFGMGPPARPLSSPPLGQHGASYIFAIDLEFRLRFAQDGGNRTSTNRNLVKHETLFHNNDVHAAGEIEFRDGVVIDLNDASGSYNHLQEKLLEHDPAFSAALIKAFTLARVQVEPNLMTRLQKVAGGQ